MVTRWYGEGAGANCAAHPRRPASPPAKPLRPARPLRQNQPRCRPRCRALPHTAALQLPPRPVRHLPAARSSYTAFRPATVACGDTRFRISTWGQGAGGHKTVSTVSSGVPALDEGRRVQAGWGGFGSGAGTAAMERTA